MHTSIQKWGNSLGVRIPKAVATNAKVCEGTIVDVLEDGEQLRIVPVREPHFDLDDLLKRVTKKNCHSPVDFGSPVGKEVW
jgi:antitoxin MazE